MKKEDVVSELRDAIKGFPGNPTEPQKLALAEKLIEYQIFKKSSKAAALQKIGLPRKDSFIKALNEIEGDKTIQGKATLNVSESYLTASHEDAEIPLLERAKKLEIALGLLVRFYEKYLTNKEKSPGSDECKLEYDFLLAIANAYLLRSKIIHLKGRTIPEKKEEAIEKGIFYAEEAIKNVNGDLKAYRINAQLYMEQERIGIKNPEKLKEALKKAFNAGCNDYSKLEDMQIAIRYIESKPLTEIESSYVDCLKQIIESTELDSSLEKAKVYRLLRMAYPANREWNEGLETSKQEISQRLQDSYLSDSIWDATVQFIKQLKNDAQKNPNDCWKNWALEVYRICRDHEEETPTPHLRWYWSKQRDLYDLAFLAESDPAENARIADSVKSRMSLRLSSLEEIGKQHKNIKDYLELMVTDAYIRGAKSRIKYEQRKLKKKDATKKSPELEAIHENFVVIHFYLVQLDGEKRGYALIYDGKTCTWKEKMPFGYDDLFSAFLTWQENYACSKEAANKQLVDLCEAIGKAMSFLFDVSIIPPDSKVLFVPHDFLHRLPLHAAINNDKVFLKEHASCYLPAWSMGRKVEVKSARKVEGGTKRKILLKNFDGHSFETVNGHSFEEVKSRFSDYCDKATPEDLTNITDPPELLVILCHGQADQVNPFFAKLKLANGGITHLKILESEEKPSLSGSRVILGACETDLVPPLSDLLDEHLSMAVAFLGKGAREVLGTLWEVEAGKKEERILSVHAESGNMQAALGVTVEELILSVHAESDMTNALWRWQSKKISSVTSPRNDVDFYFAAPFRVSGFGYFNIGDDASS